MENSFLKEQRILVIGPQGVGKSTQGNMLADFLNLPYISTGDAMREKAKEDSEKGRKVKELLETGKLAPDEVVAEFVRTRLEREDCGKGFILDGYPRKIIQINMYDPKFTAVFYLDAPDEIVMKRLIERKRPDDTPELIAQRLKIYHGETEPIVEYYINQGILQKIDGTGTIEEIQKEIREKL